jgi:hypothetical protein
LFAAGEKGLDKLKAKAHEMGIVFDQEAANKAAALTDSLTTLKGSVQGVTMGIAGKLVPALTVFVDAISTSLTKIKGDTGAMTAGVLNFFKLIAKGVMGLGLIWHGLQAVIFKVASMVVKSIRFQIEAVLLPLRILAKIPGAGIVAQKVLDGVAQHTDHLKTISDGYNETAEVQLDKATNLVVVFEQLEASLNAAAEAYENVKTGSDKLPDSFSATLPPARDMAAVVKGAQDSLDSYVFATERVKTANELLMESWNLTNEAQLEFADMAISAFVNMEAGLKGFVKSILDTLERWAIGEIIPRVMAALPFPANLLAVGGAIAAIKTLFAGLTSFKEGGFVPRETIARLHPGEFVINAPTVKALVSPSAAMGRGPFTFSPTVNIYARTLDDRTINQTAEKLLARLEDEKGRFG